MTFTEVADNLDIGAVDLIVDSIGKIDVMIVARDRTTTRDRIFQSNVVGHFVREVRLQPSVILEQDAVFSTGPELCFSILTYSPDLRR